MKYFVYVIQSLKNGQLYKGMTANVEIRLNEHNTGRSFSTKFGIPWELVYVEEFEDGLSARKHEKYLKSGRGREFLKNKLNGLE